MYNDKLIQKSEFFTKYSITNDDFDKTTLLWSNLEEIYENYISIWPLLDSIGTLIFNTIMKSTGVHSVRYRIKDPEHVIEKIIRKKKDNPSRIITIDTYTNELTDLIGVRALHLFKDDWLPVHDFVTKSWDLKEQGVAYLREGDSEAQKDKYKEFNLEPKVHNKGYRSVHYTIETKPGKVRYFSEIQVRTIFEEAWSEIDHTIRYPYDQDNVLFTQFLLILNRLAGSADEMGTFVSNLKTHLTNTQVTFENELSKKDKIIEELQTILKKPVSDSSDLEKISEGLTKIKSLNSKEYFQEFFKENSNYDIKKFSNIWSNLNIGSSFEQHQELLKSINKASIVDKAIMAPAVSAALDALDVTALEKRKKGKNKD